MSYQWLLFDADGTLFDYFQAEDNALVQNFRHHGLPFQVNYREKYRQINHHFWQRFEQKQVTPEELRIGRFRQLFSELDIDYDAGAFSETYLDQLAGQATLFAGAASLIEQLSHQRQLAIITNGLADVQYPRLERSGIQPYFSAIIVSDEVGVAKPNAGIFDEAFRRMKHPAREDVLIIGDSLTSDMAGGVNYGIDTCWFNPDGHQADPNLPITYEIKQLAELCDIV